MAPSLGAHVEIQTHLAGRRAKLVSYVAADDCGAPSDCIPFASENVSGNGRLSLQPDHAEMSFTGPMATYEFRTKLAAAGNVANGFTILFRLEGWSALSYLAIGHTAGEAFRHIKIRHVVQNQWQAFTFSPEDLAYMVQHNYDRVDSSPISDVRLYVKGRPEESGAVISVAAVGVWSSKEEQPSSGGMQADRLQLGASLRNCLAEYLRGTNEFITRQASNFLSTGSFPIHGDILLKWEASDAVPAGVAENPTFRYIWHSLYPAAYMALYSSDENDLRAVGAARDIVVGWLNQNYYQASADMRYAWYDHGTAERLISFLFVLDAVKSVGCDARFREQVEEAAVSHARLLESESFYAANQNSRYHNHAWFQDIALMAAGIALTDRLEGGRWVERARCRLEAQFGELIVRDSGYAVFAENSIGYHQGIQSLVALAGKMIGLAGGGDMVSEVSDELALWSEFLRYPDRRSPAQGDTFHLANPVAVDQRARVPYKDPAATLLPTAGYGVVKGNHGGKPFMLCFFATSRSRTHKHEDNLSLTLFFDGIEWLVDPSFYSHDYSAPVPAYLRSAWAHNTVAIVGMEQSIEPGLASLSGSSGSGHFEFRGEHSAYSGFIVGRKIAGSFATGLSVEILDSVEPTTENGETQVDARTVFHLGEGVVPQFLSGGVLLQHANSRFGVFISCAASSTSYFGVGATQEETSVIGSSFGRYEDSYSVHFSHAGSGKLVSNISVVDSSQEFE